MTIDPRLVNLLRREIFEYLRIDWNEHFTIMVFFHIFQINPVPNFSKKFKHLLKIINAWNLNFTLFESLKANIYLWLHLLSILTRIITIKKRFACLLRSRLAGRKKKVKRTKQSICGRPKPPDFISGKFPFNWVSTFLIRFLWVANLGITASELNRQIRSFVVRSHASPTLIPRSWSQLRRHLSSSTPNTRRLWTLNLSLSIPLIIPPSERLSGGDVRQVTRPFPCARLGVAVIQTLLTDFKRQEGGKPFQSPLRA